jgi:uncharacterized RDD family membrane protein YckC
VPKALEPRLAALRLPVASPLRRVAAWLLDYLIIAAYLVVLTAASFGLLGSPAHTAYMTAMSRPLTAELGGFLLLTVPVVLYFADSRPRSGPSATRPRPRTRSSSRRPRSRCPR